MKARLLVAGAMVGAVLAVGLWLAWAGSNARTASITLRVMDEATGQPVTGTVTIRRETLDGELIGAEDGETYTGQTITIEAPVDPNAYLWVLVEAEGYHDWELKFRIKTEGTADGPVRLKRIEPASPTENG